MLLSYNDKAENINFEALSVLHSFVALKRIFGSSFSSAHKCCFKSQFYYLLSA